MKMHLLNWTNLIHSIYISSQVNESIQIICVSFNILSLNQIFDPNLQYINLVNRKNLDREFETLKTLENQFFERKFTISFHYSNNTAVKQINTIFINTFGGLGRFLGRLRGLDRIDCDSSLRVCETFIQSEGIIIFDFFAEWYLFQNPRFRYADALQRSNELIIG